jgi:hypothetical protein
LAAVRSGLDGAEQDDSCDQGAHGEHAGHGSLGTVTARTKRSRRVTATREGPSDRGGACQWRRAHTAQRSSERAAEQEEQAAAGPRHPTTPPGLAGGQNTRRKRDAIAHLTPGSRDPVFLSNQRQKGEGPDVTVPALLRLTGAQFQPRPGLTIPRHALTPELHCSSEPYWLRLGLLLFHDEFSPPAAGAGRFRLPRDTNSSAERLTLLQCLVLWFLWAPGRVLPSRPGVVPDDPSCSITRHSPTIDATALM